MNILIVGLVIFLSMHSIRIFADGWRKRQIDRLGKKIWRGLYSLAALSSFGLIVWGFRAARLTPVVLWVPPFWTHYVTGALMLPAFVLLAAAYVPGNRLKARIGHPMLAATKIWALAHLLANGTLADVVLFGAFLVWAMVSFGVLRRRDRVAGGVNYPVLGQKRDMLTHVIGILAWVFFAFYGHLWLIGVQPFG